MIAFDNLQATGRSGLTPQQIQSLTNIRFSIDEVKRILNDLRNVVSVQNAGTATQDLKEYIRNVHLSLSERQGT